MVFTNFEDYYQKFSSSVLTEDNFKNNNYVLVNIPDDSCTNSYVVPTDYKINDNNILVTRNNCGDCATNYTAYLLKVSKDVINATVDFEFKAINNIKCN